ncbi:MAG: PEP-CTERM sorting domain-containing protein [Phycisphaerales bacterium]
MKKQLMLVAGTAIAITSAASADVVINFSGDLGALDMLTASVTDVTGTLSSIDVSFDYAEAVQDGSWASDAQMIVADGTNDFIAGGFTDIGAADTAWAFDGPGSDGDGTYGENFIDADWAELAMIGDDGDISISFQNNWDADANANSYDVTIILKGIEGTVVPAPGALALLGLAGFAGRRRRRG